MSRPAGANGVEFSPDLHHRLGANPTLGPAPARQLRHPLPMTSPPQAPLTRAGRWLAGIITPAQGATGVLDEAYGQLLEGNRQWMEQCNKRQGIGPLLSSS